MSRRAKDIFEAIAFAQEAQAAFPGTIFRGQRDARWRIVSSMGKPGTDPQANLQALGRFLSWSDRTHGLETLELEQKVAIGQHYGVPTTFTDWTTSAAVAAFFASDGAAVGDIGRIYLLDPDEWLTFSAVLPSVHLDIHRLHVPDLWRLQRQAGLFIEMPLQDVEGMFSFESITFPHTEESIAQADARRSLYYPDVRSPLEQRLEDYKWDDQHWKRTHAPEWKDVERAFPVTLVIERKERARITQDAAEGAWTDLPDEPAADHDTARDVRLPVPSSLNEETIRELLPVCVSLLDSLNRDLPVRVSPDASSSSPTGPALAKIFESTWNGMRWLPYKDEDITEVITRAINRVMLYSRLRATESPGPAERIATTSDEALLLELGIAAEGPAEPRAHPLQFEFAASHSNGYQRGWCEPALIDNALTAQARSEGRPWLDLQREGWHVLDLFALEPFLRCWRTSLLPSQLAYRSLRSGANPVYFSPTWIDVFGLA